MYDVCEVLNNLPPAEPEYRRKPVFIIAHTTKGQGVDFMENDYKWHGGGIAKEQLDQALASVENRKRVR